MSFEKIDKNNIPHHIAVIMDGNGRWGLKKKNSRNYGHKKGLETIDQIISFCIKKKVEGFLFVFKISMNNS